MTRLQPCNAARKLATRCTLPIGTLFRRVRYTDTNLVGYRFSNHYHHHHRRASCHRCNHPSCHRFLSSSQQCWAGTSFNARHTRFSRFLSNFAISPPTIFGREWNCCSSTQSSSENRRTSSLIDFAIVPFFFLCNLLEHCYNLCSQCIVLNKFFSYTYYTIRCFNLIFDVIFCQVWALRYRQFYLQIVFQSCNVQIVFANISFYHRW